MADDPKGKPKEGAQAAPAAAASAGGAKKGPPIKTIVVVLVMLVVEAGAIVGALSMFGKPAEVKAVGLEEHTDAAEDKTVEIPIVTESFTNNASGRLWIWKVEVFAVVKKRHAGEPPAPPGAAPAGGEHGGGGHGDAKDAKAAGAHADKPPMMSVREELESRKAEVRTGIGAIFSAAQHSYFTEPGRETVSRQVLEYLRQVFGQDEKGEERIQKVLIPNCIGQAIDT